MSMDTVSVRWPVPARIAFRFACAYWVIYTLPGILSFLPKGEWLAEHYLWLWDRFVPHVGDALFGLDAHRHPSGSGDSANDWVTFACQLGLAAVVTAVWTLVDRRFEAYPRLRDGLRVLVRYTLGATLCSYGLAKVFYGQFLPPEGERLMRSFGESSPMGILWTFMGASYAYCLFTGLVEILAGVLLFWRRTTLLGALVAAGAMVNVVMLNFCYDVPVKLYSSHLLVMALWLALPDLRRLVDFFLLHRPTAPQPLRVATGLRWVDRARLPLKVVVLGWLAYLLVSESLEGYREWGPGKKAKPMVGIWKVERHAAADAAPLPDAVRWRRITFSPYETATVTYLDGHQDQFSANVEGAGHFVELTPMKAPPAGPPTRLDYTYVGVDRVTFTGTLGGQAMEITATLLPPSSFPLNSRGFHWIQEYPFNR